MVVTSLLETVLAMFADVVQRKAPFVAATNRNYAAPVTGGHKSTALIAVPSVFTTRDVAAGADYVSDPDAATKEISLTEHRAVSFSLSDFNQEQVSQGIIPANLTSAADSMRKYIESFIAGKMAAAAYLHVGTADVVPFGQGVEEFWGAMAKLDEQDIEENRQLILTPRGNESLNSTRDLRDKNFAGLSVPYGWSNQVASDSAAGTGYEVDSAGAALGATTVPLKTGSGSMVGAVIEFAGHEGSYVVETQSGTSSMTVYPALRAAVTNGEDITKVSGGKQSILCTPNATAFACSAMQDAVVPSGSDIAYLNDPASGLAFRLEVSRDSKLKKTVWDIDAAFGAVVAFRNGLVRISGK